MPFDAQTILEQLSAVEAERSRRRDATGLAAQVQAIKLFQQRRFEHTYSDLLASPRHVAAARFFLEELYGPQDFEARDAQFTRVVPALVRLFPQSIVDVVGALARLGASELTPVAYVDVWRGTGQPAQRETQIALTLEVGAALDRLVHQALLRQSLRLMRGPARAAGLAELQKFLEHGFDTFREMRSASEFLACIGGRERKLVAALFAANPGDPESLRRALDQLPGAPPSG